MSQAEAVVTGLALLSIGASIWAMCRLRRIAQAMEAAGADVDE